MANTQGIIGAYSSVINYPYALVTHFFLLYSKEELHFKKPRKTPESPLQVVYSRKMKTCLHKTYDCMWVCTVALLIINPTRKQPTCLSTGEWINKSHHIHTIAQHYPIKKRNKLLLSNNTGEIANALCQLKDARLKRLHTMWFYLYDILEKAKW